MSPRFGTDGVRGRAYDELDLAFVERLGAAAAAVLGPGPFYVGRDTRESGPDFEAALARGLASGGATTIALGVVPTPAVAWLAAADGVAGVMISASHNPYHDNGIKLFGVGGSKLTDERQDAVQAALDAGERRAHGTGAAHARHDLVNRYADAVAGSIGHRLDGLHLVIDCANGSNSFVAAPVLQRLGARVQVLHDAPDGRNINDRCGSTHPGDLVAAVVAAGADAGLAFDGDADRVVAVDHTGALVDGDQIIAILALDRHARGRLVHDSVVVTVMANLGFRQAMAAHGITVIETPVGDRYVLEALEATGAALGGEQSGHVIFRDLATTGDGLLTGVQLLDVVARTGRSLHELAGAAMTRLPQVLRNVVLAARVPDLGTAIAAHVAAAEARLAGEGRILIRPSGTEPLVRIMVEAPTEALAGAVADDLAGAVAAVVGG